MYSYNKEYEESRRLLVMAIASVKAEEHQSAKRMLEKILRIPSTSEQTANAHYWLSIISQDPEEERGHLELALGYYPAHHLARKKLAIINGKLKESEIIDPNNLPHDIQVEPIKSEVKRTVCGNCGGELTFSPDGNYLVCEYCESQKRIALNGSVNETEFVIGISTISGHKKAISMQSVECEACKAVFLIKPETLSITCPYCESIYAINTPKTTRLIPPEGIIPFTIDEKEAKRILLEWLKRNKVSKKPHIEPFKGIYLPVWTFDISGNIKWTGTFSQNESLFPVSDQKYMFLNDVMVPATINCPFKFTNILSKYHSGNIRPYSHEYTANWLAETYSVSMSDAAINARSKVFKEAIKILEEDDEINTIGNLNFSSAGLIIEGFKLILVPVWLGEYIFTGHYFNVTINGNSGDIQGELPPTRLERFTKWILKK